jgi:hypothetical protein
MGPEPTPLASGNQLDRRETHWTFVTGGPLWVLLVLKLRWAFGTHTEPPVAEGNPLDLRSCEFD